MQKLQILIIGLNWPEPTATAAGERMMQLIHCFKEFGYQVCLGSAAKDNVKSEILEELDISMVQLKLNSSSFDTFIEDLDPGIVIFDRFISEEYFGWRVVQYAPNAIRVLDTEDLHSLRLCRKNAVENEVEFTPELWLQNDLTKREIASIYRCDLSLIISDYEMQLLQNKLKVPSSLLMYLPFMLDAIKKAIVSSWPNFEERQNFIFIGNGKHTPNTDAILWLHEEIWPLIRKELPHAELHIYGAYIPQYIAQLYNHKTGFLVKGRVADAAEAMSGARVNLAPLRYGAGIKGKVIQAIRNGTPNVLTPIAAEGIIDESEIQNNNTQNTKGFVARAIRLYTNKEDWKLTQTKETAILNGKFNKVALSANLYGRIEYLRNNLKPHRTSNFTGAMLLHHSTASTKHLAKWIECKNAQSGPEG